MNEVPRVCLIIDNPLRDLDGLILVGWHLARQGVDTFLVPMYSQTFDVPALKPDMVLANYVRPNNADLLKAYKEAGILVGVLDTEGAAGKTPDDYARMVGRMRCGDYVDLYCVWGRSQFEAFRRHHTVPQEILRLTGCPRYDFCAVPWRTALPAPRGASDYVLVNTNFPVVNPRFSKNAGSEYRSMVQAGFDESFARQFVADARVAHQAVIEVMERLARSRPDLTFVLRPHPFENADAYKALLQFPNCQVRQEGTSLEWINGARLLLHQNCSTALEAVMLGKEPISLEWFNTPALSVPSTSAVSLRAQNYEAASSLIDAIVTGHPPVLDSECLRAREKLIEDLYYSVDGRSAARAAAAMREIIEAKRATNDTALCKRRYRKSLRSMLLRYARGMLGYRTYEAIRVRMTNETLERRRRAKFFSVEEVGAVLDRINKAAATPPCVAEPAIGDSGVSRMLSGHTIHIRTSKCLDGPDLNMRNHRPETVVAP